MSPTGQLMSDWLKTKPGVFRANEYEGVLDLAYKNSPFLKRSVPFEDFKGCLKRAGYEPVERKRHGEGVSYWQLNLPEGL